MSKAEIATELYASETTVKIAQMTEHDDQRAADGRMRAAPAVGRRGSRRWGGLGRLWRRVRGSDTHARA